MHTNVPDDDSVFDALSELSSSEHDTDRIPSGFAPSGDPRGFFASYCDPIDAAEVLCRACATPRLADDERCVTCGWRFLPASGEGFEVPLLNERYLLGDRIAERRGVERFRAFDMEHGGETPLPVIVLAQPVGGDLEVWPGVAWEHRVLSAASHLALPRVIDRFADGEREYLVEEMPLGRTLWEAWDDPLRGPRDRFGWLGQVAEAMGRLARAGALPEEVRPEMVVITPGGQAVLADIGGLIPIPMTPDVLLRATPYTPPELLLTPTLADGRAGIYAFGAMLYALMLGRELTELDFTGTGIPRPFLDRFADAHPLLGRLMGKTFTRDLRRRYPTDDGAIEDPTGFRELGEALDICRKQLGRVRYEIGAWTTTGMYRSGNEDAYAVIHASDARQDDSDETALVVLADGMGGMDSGEVAASMAVQILRTELLTQPPFASLAAGVSAPPRPGPISRRLRANSDDGDTPTEEVGAVMRDFTGWRLSGVLHRGLARDPSAREPEACHDRILLALKEANRQIHQAAKNGLVPRGMGCTAEVLHLDGSLAVIGHVGDSRTYHLTGGRFTQVTRDHTLVNRLIELGQLTPEEAEYHPRRAELQQAIGGRPDVDPELYTLHLKPGDWLLVCSDGLTNQIKPDRIQAVVQRTGSAEKAARLLVNLANLEGASDNVTVVVVRVIGP